MIGRHDETALWASTARNFLKVLHLDVAEEIFLCQSRTPQQVDHGPCEMLKRLAGNFSPLVDRELVAKRDLEIVQRDLVSVAIKEGHEHSGRLGKAVACSPRKQRD